jgi:pimeloyl-ACP methyl ester carboxylesterase
MSHRFEVGDVTIRYLDWGEGSPRQLILLHGLGSQAHTWDTFGNEVTTSFRVIAPDLRGHGESGHSEEGYAPAHFVGDVKALARVTNLPSFDLVGHSLGALIAIEFAAEHPDLVNRLVLEDGGPGLDTDAARGGSIGNFTRPLAFDTLESAGSWLQAQNPRLSTRSGEEMEQMVKHRMKENWVGRWVFRHDSELYWIVDDAPGWSSEDSKQGWERLASISCPTLILRGEESELLSSDAAAQITDAIPDATLVEIPGAGHSIHSDAPDLFREAVLGFLERDQ